ncbi:hypothetical protein F8M41_000350 [Gigaspora margarita]|uniref:CCHC-type domain-containing protein n=1 Tax=Gigaspora margarita TaxID=4874 RepID=A0A8H4ESQ0_GIGMA|nr:hypothetical protein F8M41_000350 [Gigaspora margarita]
MMGTVPTTNLNSGGTEEALNRMTEVINRMMTQMQDQRRPFRPRQSTPPTTPNSGIVCYNCGRPGHIVCQCPNLRNSATNGPSAQATPVQSNPPISNTNGVTSQDTLQALLALINTVAPASSQSNQSSYLGIPEDDENLFLPADQHVRQKPIVSTTILRKSKNGQDPDPSSGLVETERVTDPDVEMVEGTEKPEQNSKERSDSELNNKDEKKALPKRATIPKRKIIEEELPQISSLVTPYSIIADIRDKAANITYVLESRDNEKRNDDDSDEEYEEEKLEEQIFAYSEVEVEIKDVLEEGENIEGNNRRIKERKDYDIDEITEDNYNKIIKGKHFIEEGKQNQGLWPVDHLSFSLEEHTSISDLFDYYYENEVQTVEEYKIGNLEKTQRSRLGLLLDEYDNLCARSINELGRIRGLLL